MFKCIYALWLLLWGSCFKMHCSLQSCFSLYQQIAKPRVTYSVHELYHFGEEEPPAYTGHLQPQTTFKHLIIIIMEICKAPTLRLKALNKHTHIVYIEMENVVNLLLFNCIYIDKCSSIIMQKKHTDTHTRTHIRSHTHTHTHTHTHIHTHTHSHCTDWWEWRTMWFNWNILTRI